MSEWIPLLQSLVWPLFMAAVAGVWLFVRARMKLTGQAEISFPVIGTVKVHDLHALILLGFVLLATGQFIPGFNPTLALLFKAAGALLLVVGVATLVIYSLRHGAA
jgi:hypothetical protein